MKYINLLPLTVLTVNAFIIPEEQVMRQITIESDKLSDSVLDKLPSKNNFVKDIEDSFSTVVDTSKTTFDQAFKYAHKTGKDVANTAYDAAFDVHAWLNSAADMAEDLADGSEQRPSQPHDGKGNYRSPPPHDGNGGKGHHGHGEKPNATVRYLKIFFLL